MKQRTFERQLPSGYQEVFSVDAENKKTVVIMNIATLLIFAGFAVLFYYLIRPTDFFGNFSWLRSAIFILALPAYIVLHELVHGAVYKCLTHEKLTFGMTLSVAYCGVPNIFVYRRTAMLSLLAPFVLFSLIFGALVLILSNPWDKMYAAFALALHIAGCVGDLYDTLLFVFKLRDPAILMQDTGPKQTFYQKAD